VIGHLEGDCRLRRCHLKGAEGDALHAVACAVGLHPLAAAPDHVFVGVDPGYRNTMCFRVAAGARTSAAPTSPTDDAGQASPAGRRTGPRRGPWQCPRQQGACALGGSKLQGNRAQRTGSQQPNGWSILQLRHT